MPSVILQQDKKQTNLGVLVWRTSEHFNIIKFIPALLFSFPAMDFISGHQLISLTNPGQFIGFRVNL